jgi:hypothetical protein
VLEHVSRTDLPAHRRAALRRDLIATAGAVVGLPGVLLTGAIGGSS